jgi:hypothetical protein
MNEIIEKIDDTIKLNDLIEDEVVKDIPSKYDIWHNNRKSNIDDFNEIIAILFLLDSSKNTEYIMTDLFQQYLIRLAHLVKSVLPSYDSSFEVSGKNIEASKVERNEKALIVNELEHMDYYGIMSELVNDCVLTGESIAFVSWEKKIKQLRRKKTILEKMQEKLQNNISQIFTKQEAYLVVEVIDHIGSNVSRVNPHDFVFDIARKQKWDSCQKIYRTWATFEDLLESSLYSDLLHKDKEKKEFLKNLVKNDDDSRTICIPENKDRVNVKDGQLEILEFWGDYKLKSGKMLKNWVITIAGGNKVIRFEPNPLVINPFIRYEYLEDPKTKRAVPPLKIALNNNNLMSKTVSQLIKCIDLTILPHRLAPKGFFKGETEMKPGGITEYSDTMGMPDASKIVTVDSSKGLQIFNFIPFFQKQIENGTGFYQNMGGNTEASQRTATEMKGVFNGQAVRLSFEQSKIAKDLHIPILKAIDEMNKNFRDKPLNLRMNESDGKPNFNEIGEETWLQDFDFIIGDSASRVEKKMQSKEKTEFLVGAYRQNPQAFDGKEIFREGANDYEIENPDRFFAKDVISNVLQGLTPEQQDIVKNKLAEITPIVINQLQQEAQNGQTGNPQSLDMQSNQQQGISRI